MTTKNTLKIKKICFLNDSFMKTLEGFLNLELDFQTADKVISLYTLLSKEYTAFHTEKQKLLSDNGKPVVDEEGKTTGYTFEKVSKKKLAAFEEGFSQLLTSDIDLEITEKIKLPKTIQVTPATLTMLRGFIEV